MPHSEYPHIAVVTLTESIGPVDRGAKYEDPLDAALRAQQAGAVCGGGTQLDASHAIAFVDIEVALRDQHRSIELLRTTLKHLGAPAGSVLTYTRDGVPTVIAIDTGAPAAPPGSGIGAMRRRLRETPAAGSPATGTYDNAVVTKTAERLLAAYRKLFVESYPVAPIEREAYPAEHFAWYDATAAVLALEGFVPVGDLKNVQDASIPEPGAQPFARRFVSPRERTHRIDAFQVKAPKSDSWTRVVNIVTELTDGHFLWTTTAAQRWNRPDHTLIETLPADTSAAVVLAHHRTRFAAYVDSHPGIAPVPVSTLGDVVSSENRCQARTAAFRRAQRVPSVDELLRLGSEPGLATLAHQEMVRMVNAEPTANVTPGGAWSVTTAELPVPGTRQMSLVELIQFGLDQGIAQVAQVGSPLNPFLITETGTAYFFLCTAGNADPMEIALQTLRTDAAGAARCALVLDSRITLSSGGKQDAIVVMAAERGAGDGVTWAQAYRPKGFLKAFKVLDFREQVATSRNLFTEAGASTR